MKDDTAQVLAEYERQTRPDYWQVDADRIADYLQCQYLGKPQVVCENAAGSWRALEFDTEVFAVPMGRIDWVAARDLYAPGRAEIFSQLLAEAKGRKIEQLSLRLSVLDVPLLHIAEDAGFRLLTAFVGLARPVGVVKNSLENIEMRPALDSDLPDLISITDEAFVVGTRFHLDPNMAYGAQTLHRRWIENCIDGLVADRVIVAIEDKLILGYITAQVDPLAKSALCQSRGTIGLFAVRKAARGRGIGAALLNAVNQYLTDLAVERVEVGTEASNSAALNAYMRAGFKVVQSCFTMHYWLNRS